MPLKKSLWLLAENEELVKTELSGSQWLPPAGGRAPVGAGDTGALLVQAIDSVGQTVAVALVPDAPDAAISCNGLPLGPGLHALCHGDQLQVNETPFWISVEATHDEARYDPARHGPDVFCFITKARLSESDPIVICPGTPGNSCGVICTQRAWAMARESPKPLRCPNCGYDSRQRTWRPVWGKRRDPLGELFAIIASRSAEK